MLKKTFIILALIIFSTLILGGFVLAQDKELEVTYPTVPGAGTPTKLNTPLPEYVRYIFNFSIWIAGLIAFVAVFYGGVRYLTSGGSPSATTDAKDQIFSGILGLIIIFSAYTILVNINPQLVILRADPEATPAVGEIPGVYLCKSAELSADNCIAYLMTSDTIDPNFDDEVRHVYLKNPSQCKSGCRPEDCDKPECQEPIINYGVVLHQDKGRKGTCQVILNDSSVALPDGEPSSVTVFKITQDFSGEGVTLYEGKEYNKQCGENCYANCPEHDQKCNDCKKCWGPYVYEKEPKNIEFEGLSIEIYPPGKYLAVIFEKTDGEGRCEVFTQSDPDLASNYIGICKIGSDYGCFGSIVALPIK